ncbi:hypothetical protein FBU59_001792 [Linderina macrospora]|uniref:Uncharacterized protein n=1 Tax=Linderina macrospora TaxID=4868 RepID=A0ACC1JD78_9FUNG|nr:hypothetical protein FBU59_001792 [Linderina macrospora]
MGLGSNSSNGQKPKEQSESQMHPPIANLTQHVQPAELQSVDKSKKRLPELPTEFSRAFSNDVLDLPMPRIHRNRSQSDSNSDKYLASPIARQRHAAHKMANLRAPHSHALYLNESASASMGNTNKALPDPPVRSPDAMYANRGRMVQTYYEH